MKITDKVGWIMPEDSILKLEKMGKTYDISTEVINYLDKAGLFEKLDDKNVEVEIDESTDKEEGATAGTITHLNIVEAGTETPKEESKKETTPEPASDLYIKEVTVGGVSVEKAGVKMKEDKENKTWYTLDSTLKAQKFKDECTGKTIEITVAPQEKGNDVIKSYIIKEEEKKESKENKKNYKGTGNSIEAQAAMKAANVIASQMVDKDTLPEFVEKLITRIATHNFKTIQDLKNKE